jgi:uncharacterized protein (DUF2141 family)
MVHVHRVKNDQGTIKVKLYGDKAKDFMRTGKKLDAKRVPAKKELTELCVHAPHPGSYALVVHHDANSNKKYGFSNNPKIVLAPPSHEEVIFEAKEDITHIHVYLEY